MKQFILKNIVLATILVLTLIGSVFLIFFIWEKSQTIKESMKTIQADGDTVKSINSARKPNSVEQSEKLIKADTESLNKKKVQIYRHFGNPCRQALLKLIRNIASPAELKTDLPIDPSLVARPKPKTEAEDGEDDEEEVADAAPAESSAPTDEEKAVFNPASNLIVLSFDEDALRSMLADIYKDVHQDSADEGDTFVIPDTIQAERTQLFEKLFDQIIEAPEVVGAARAEDFRKAAAAKFAKAFAIFRDDVQDLTLENVTDEVAHELFLDALGLPRLMRQRDCKNYLDYLYERYSSSDIIPGLPSDDPLEKERRVQDFIYGKKLNRQAIPPATNVIPIIRNFQIKEDLFRRMKDAGIGELLGMTVSNIQGTPMDENDSESPILVFSYTLDMTASMEAIDAFINSLHSAYKSDRVYVVKDIKFSSPYEDLISANAIVASHTEDASAPARRTAAATANQNLPAGAQQPAANGPAANQQQNQVVTVVPARTEYELSDPHHPDYGKTLIGEARDEIKCTIVVNYLFYRADNITPQ